MSWDDINEKLRHLAELAERPDSAMEKVVRRHIEELKHQQAAAERAPSYPMPSNLDKLSMRMGWHGSRIKTFEHIDIVAFPTKVLVWAITNGDFQSVVIEDDPSMFPSDTLRKSVNWLCDISPAPIANSRCLTLPMPQT